jgi:hypothetical protein
VRTPGFARRARCPAAVGLALALLAGWTQAPEERRVTIEQGVRFGDGGPEEPCDGPDVDPWIGELRDRVLSYDGLALWAVDVYGAPTSCDGAVMDEFDGAKFGAVVLGFADGVALTVETMPPEVSIVSLRAPTGFADGPAVLLSLRAYAATRGLAIDWDAPPETSVDEDESTATYWDPDTGLNGSASLVTVDDALVEVRVIMAL